MISSARIQESILEYLEDKENHSVQEIKNHLSDVGISSNDYSEGQFAGSINTLLRNGSIKKIHRGIYAIKKGKENMKRCFVVSPIGDPESDIRKNADKLFKYIIKPVCEECDFEAIRVDQLNDANSITQTIIDELENSDLVIADVTGNNPNVFYEMGFRARTKKPIIHLKSKGENLPFDIATIRALEYDLTDLDNVEEVKSRLLKTVKTFTFPNSDETEVDNDDVDTALASITPTLYQILDSISGLRNDMKRSNAETISAVVKATRNTQSHALNEDARREFVNKLIQFNTERSLKQHDDDDLDLPF